MTSRVVCFQVGASRPLFINVGACISNGLEIFWTVSQAYFLFIAYSGNCLLSPVVYVFSFLFFISVSILYRCET